MDRTLRWALAPCSDVVSFGWLARPGRDCPAGRAGLDGNRVRRPVHPGAVSHGRFNTGVPDEPGSPPYRVLLDETDWGALHTAFGSGEDLPDILLRLLEPDPAAQVAALSELGELGHHQNTIYEAAAPAVMYVAGILDHPVAKALRPYPGGGVVLAGFRDLRRLRRDCRSDRAVLPWLPHARHHHGSLPGTAPDALPGCRTVPAGQSQGCARSRRQRRSCPCRTRRTRRAPRSSSGGCTPHPRDQQCYHQPPHRLEGPRSTGSHSPCPRASPGGTLGPRTPQ